MSNVLRDISLNVAVELVTEVCIACGGVFALPSDLVKELRRNHQSLYCPVGHRQFYPEKSREEQLQAELEAEGRRRLRLSAQLDQANTEVAALEKAKRKLERAAKATARRTTNGVCTECKRTFANVTRHMQTQHLAAIITAELAT